MGFKDDKPCPRGWEYTHWERSYNAANSRIYTLHGNSSDAARRYRANGATRELAHTINPPASAGPPPGALNPHRWGTLLFILNFEDELTRSIETRVKEFSAVMAPAYPLSLEQKKLIDQLNVDHEERFTGLLLDIMRECANGCAGEYKDCATHQKQTKSFYEFAFVNVPMGSWAWYRPASYKGELQNMLDSNVGLPELNARIAKEQRLHTKQSLCTILPFDHPESQEAKTEAAILFDNPAIKQNDIIIFLESRNAELRAKLTPEERELQDKFRLCETKEDQYAFYEQVACDPTDKDCIADTKMKAKWRELFKSNKPYDEIRTIMKKDIEQAGIAVQSLQTRIADIEMAQAGHIRDKEKKKTDRQEHRLICSGSSCNNVCVGYNGMEPIQCAQCNEDCLQMKRDTRSYFCSQHCVDVYGVEHRISHHSGPECSAHDCTNNCVGNLTLESPQCLRCKTEFLAGQRPLQSYFCSQECVDRSGGEHIRLFHPEPQSTN